jgi:hypothetical protein
MHSLRPQKITMQLTSLTTFFALLICALLLPGCSEEGPPCEETFTTTHGELSADVVVYSATPSGLAATLQAHRLGRSVILLEPTRHIGGMSSSGIGIADVGNRFTIGGIAKEFFAKVASIYGSGVPDALEGRAYEPHVAEAAFEQMLPRCNVRLVRGVELAQADKNGSQLLTVSARNGSRYRGRVFIDASYEGDLLAAAGIDHTVGRESNTTYGESRNGVGNWERMFGQPVDPYVRPGVPSSGLIDHVSATAPGPAGSADDSVMAYNYRLCITKNRSNQIPFTQPPGYREAEFEVLARLSEHLVAARADHRPPFNYYLTPVPLPNGKYDLNTGGYVSTDYVGASKAYPNASPEDRRSIAQEHERYTKALLYFLQTSPRIPDYIRNEVAAYGLCRDEFVDNGGWPYQLYLREGRRMLGDYVITEDDIDGRRQVSDPIGLGSFYYDSHLYNRWVKGGAVVTERNPNGDVLAYPISLRTLMPKSGQASNLLVSVCVSASHSAFTSLRVEPTYMIMGQAAGAVAALAAEMKLPVQSVPYDRLAQTLQNQGQILHLP